MYNTSHQWSVFFSLPSPQDFTTGFITLFICADLFVDPMFLHLLPPVFSSIPSYSHATVYQFSVSFTNLPPSSLSTPQNTSPLVSFYPSAYMRPYLLYYSFCVGFDHSFVSVCKSHTAVSSYFSIALLLNLFYV